VVFGFYTCIDYRVKADVSFDGDTFERKKNDGNWHLSLTQMLTLSLA